MDENPSRHPKPSIGRRLLRREAAVTRSSGLRLGRAVARRHERPEPVRAAMRLVPKPAGVARAAAPSPAAAPAPAPAADAWVPSATESTIMPGISDWGSEWLFGDADTAVSTGAPFAPGSDYTPRTPEQKRLSRLKRGGPEVARAAKIVEGGGAGEPVSAPAADAERAVAGRCGAAGRGGTAGRCGTRRPRRPAARRPVAVAGSPPPRRADAARRRPRASPASRSPRSRRRRPRRRDREPPGARRAHPGAEAAARGRARRR